jgi:hypothetical protein
MHECLHYKSELAYAKSLRDLTSLRGGNDANLTTVKLQGLCGRASAISVTGPKNCLTTQTMPFVEFIRLNTLESPV